MKAATEVTTPDEYVAGLPPDRRRDIAIVREAVNRSIPSGYHEMFVWGGIGWGIPLSRYPGTYNKQPLCYVALVSQKNYSSLHLMGCYGDAGQLAALKRAFADAGKRLDMGKACVHFKTAEDLPLPAIGKLIAAITPEKWIAIYERSRLMTKAGRGRAAKAATARAPGGK